MSLEKGILLDQQNAQKFDLLLTNDGSLSDLEGTSSWTVLTGSNGAETGHSGDNHYCTWVYGADSGRVVADCGDEQCMRHA